MGDYYTKKQLLKTNTTEWTFMGKKPKTLKSNFFLCFLLCFVVNSISLLTYLSYFNQTIHFQHILKSYIINFQYSPEHLLPILFQTCLVSDKLLSHTPSTLTTIQPIHINIFQPINNQIQGEYYPSHALDYKAFSHFIQHFGFQRSVMVKKQKKKKKQIYCEKPGEYLTHCLSQSSFLSQFLIFNNPYLLWKLNLGKTRNPNFKSNVFTI